MERSSVLLAAVLVVGALAGCIGDTSSGTEDDGDADDIETNQADDNGTAVLRKGASVHIVHDFTEGGDEVTFEIENRTFAEERSVYFGEADSSSPVGACLMAGGASIVVEDPSGEVVLEASNDGNVQIGTGSCAGSTQMQEGMVVLEPGTWTATFEGQGLGTGHVVLQG